jgi:hypothetical protein
VEEKKSGFRPCKNLSEPPIPGALPPIKGSPNRSGPYDVLFAGCRIFCQMLRG